MATDEEKLALKAEFRARMWWLEFPNMWRTLSGVLAAEREMAYYAGEIARVRSKYIKKGKKPKVKDV